jgi:DUF2924 family protein
MSRGMPGTAPAKPKPPRRAADTVAAGDPLATRLTALEDLDLEGLRREWERLYGAAAPTRLSRDLLRRAIAHRVQEAALGGLAPAARRRLAALARERRAGEGRPAAAPAAALRLKPGTALVREWHGRTHTVLVLAEGGFEREGQRYASPSEVARAITGVRWSGPRFFGLLRGVTRGADRRGGGAG